MADNLIFTDKEATFLRELVKNKVPFMIVGLSAANLQVSVQPTVDVDLWFKSLNHAGIEKALRKVGGIYVPPVHLNAPMFAGEHVELFDICLNMDGLESFGKEYKGAIEIPLGNVRVKVLPVKRVYASKKAANRKKDRVALQRLRAAIAVHEMTREESEPARTKRKRTRR